MVAMTSELNGSLDSVNHEQEHNTLRLGHSGTMEWQYT